MRRLPDPKEDVDARGNRFGENSKRFALQRISAALSAGMTITEAATTVGISRATYYRWINSSGSELDRQSNQNITIVGTLIDDLTRPDATVSQVRRAVVLFSLWLSNPANSLMFQGALPYFLLSYWNIKAPNSKLFDLPVEAHDDMNNINIEDILLSYNYSIDIGWHGEQFNLPGVNYSERDIFSEWAWYFIASYSEGFFPKKENIKIAMFHKLFEYNWNYSDRNFDKIWKERRSTLPFLYAESFNSNLSWELTPTQMDFSQRIDELCSDFDGRMSYFRHSRWALDAFQRSYKAGNSIPFPKFPSRVSPEPVTVRPLSDQLKAALRQGRYEHTIGSLDGTH